LSFTILFALYTIVKNRKDTKSVKAKCGRFFGQKKSLKQSPVQGM
jgi:hypothetical protein